MRAVVADQVPGTPTVWDGIEVDEPGLGEVLVRVAACGVCHSDVLAVSGHVLPRAMPFIVGHEPAGVVESVGPGVRHLQPGDHVVACYSGFCGHCADCVTGHTDRCTNKHELLRGAGEPPRLSRGGEPVYQYIELGGFAEQMLVAAHSVVKIDPTLPLERACLLGCGVLTGTGAVFNTARVPAGASVAIVGCGGVGLAIVQGARIAYARRIVAVDVDDEKLELARRCGATDAVNAANDDPVAAVHAMEPGGVDYAFEAIGRSPTVQQALAMTGMWGTTTVVGIMEDKDRITVTGEDLRMRKTVQQCMMGSNRFVADIPRLVDHVLAGRLDLDAMVSSERTLDDVPATIAELDAGKILGRAVVRF